MCKFHFFFLLYTNWCDCSNSGSVNGQIVISWSTSNSFPKKKIGILFGQPRVCIVTFWWCIGAAPAKDPLKVKLVTHWFPITPRVQELENSSYLGEELI